MGCNGDLEFGFRVGFGLDTACSRVVAEAMKHGGKIWTWRHHLARWMIHVGLKIMLPGRSRQELTEMLWVWNMKVHATVAAHRAAIADGSPP